MMTETILTKSQVVVQHGPLLSLSTAIISVLAIGTTASTSTTPRKMLLKSPLESFATRPCGNSNSDLALRLPTGLAAGLVELKTTTRHGWHISRNCKAS